MNEKRTAGNGTIIYNIQGEKVDLPSLWSDRTILLVFLRHFG